ncbi:NUDIX hydrolase [Qipengyuania sp. MTN3-11]|uniref:NUDIX hydrolase n=1 Tax=Qipengyuania sp. MTN3-11 TaxID=3056557 RepID=UPI0036F403BE
MESASTHEEIPAATLVVFRHARDGGPPEILMVVRSRDMSFAGGMAVFPGGRVDAADRALAAAIDHGLGDDDEAAHRIAAVRETIEETGLSVGLTRKIDASEAARIRDDLIACGELAPVLDRHDLALDLAALVPFARWCPRGMKHNRIFDTRFYLIDLGTGAVDIAIDRTENTRLFWTSAQAALDAADKGDISLIFPTRRNLERLALFSDFAEARSHAESIPVRTIVPQIGDREGRPSLTILEDAGYPVTHEPLDEALRG